MRPLHCHGRDDRRLSVVRGVRSEPHSLPYRGLRSIRTDNKPRRQRPAAGPDTHRVRADLKRFELRSLDDAAGSRNRIEERCLEDAVLDDVPEVGFSDGGSVKHKRTGGARRHALMPNAHVLIRTEARHADAIPRPRGPQDPLARARDRDDSRIDRRIHGRHLRPSRLEDGNPKRCCGPVPRILHQQRTHTRANRTAADDEHVEDVGRAHRGSLPPDVTPRVA